MNKLVLLSLTIGMFFYSKEATAILPNPQSSAAAQDQLLQIEESMNRNSQKLSSLQLDQQQLALRISETVERIKERRRILLQRGAALAHLKKYQFGALIDRSESLSQLDRQIKIFQRLSDWDVGLFKEYSGLLKSLSRHREELASAIQQVRNATAQLQRQQLELKVKEKKRLQDLEVRNTASLLRSKGGLARPTDGKLIWKFGSKIDDSKQFVFASPGLLFQSLPNSEIKSIGPGIVIFSDQVPSWRETIIIQHDDNYYSVYSGIKNPMVKLADKVLPNQTMGLAESDEVYFELRHFDSPINPMNWFKEPL